MGRTSVVICEFNPFHFGHLRLIEEAKREEGDRIICIMSGNFVQRGEIAVADRFTRADAALRCGADVVLELPVPFSFGSAEYFADAAVRIADGLGIADELIFGSENGDISELELVAERQMSSEFAEKLSEFYRGETGYAAAAEEAYTALFGGGNVAFTPNNILAIEYIKALRRIGSHLSVRTIKREDNFSSEELSYKYPSASAIRRLIYASRDGSEAEFLPAESYEALREAEEKGLYPSDREKYGRIAHAFLRLCDPCSLANTEGVSGGLENRLCSAALSAEGYDEMLSMLSTKKYTDARLRRTILCALLGVGHEDMKPDIPFVKLLALSESGRELLSRTRKDSRITVVTKNSDIKSLIATLPENERDDAIRLDELSRKADALYSLCLKSPKEAGFFGKTSPIIKK